MSLREFISAYIDCALWSSNADDTGGAPLDENYDRHNIAPETMAEIEKDCANFYEANAELLSKAGTDEQNGHDFWLTRNRHGAGFWDRGYPNNVATPLTDAAHAYGSVDLYVDSEGAVRS